MQNTSLYYQNPKISSGPEAWLSIFAVGSAILLLLDFFGLQTPPWLIYLVDPIAWLSNLIGLTKLWPELIFSIDDSVAAVSAWIGLPIIGSLIWWFVLGLMRFRWKGLYFIVFIVPFCVALQVTMQRAYLSMADRFHVEEQFENEVDALSKVLYIVKNMDPSSGFPRISGNSVISIFERLVELQEQNRSKLTLNNSEPLEFRVANINVKMYSDHLPLPWPQLAAQHHGFDAFKKTLALIADDFDVDDLGQLNVMDLRFYTAMAVAANLAILQRTLGKWYPKDVKTFLESPISLSIRIHSETTDLERTVSEKPHSTIELPKKAGRIVASYDRQTETLHLGVPDDVYRRQTLLLATERSEKSARQISDAMADKLHDPLVHELWHFASDNIPLFEGVPPALDEGIASWFQFMSAKISESVSDNIHLMMVIGHPGTFRDQKREQELLERMPRCSESELRFTQKIHDAKEHNTLMSLDKLLDLDSVGTIRRMPDPLLVYAEGWALAGLIMLDPEHFRQVLANHSLPNNNESNSSLMARMVEFSSKHCS